jgi:DNA-binding transcriptional regulator YbjK
METENRTAKKSKSELSSRDLIMLATLRLIAQEGIDAVTHRRVAEIAGVSPGTTTHHFAGRKGLLRESFISYLSSGDTLFTMFYATAAQDGPMAVDSVREGLVRLVEREFADASLLRAEYELMLFASRDDELGKAVTAWEARAAGAVAAVMEHAGARRPTEAARTLINFIRGFELERLVNTNLSVKEFERRLTPLLRALCSVE